MDERARRVGLNEAMFREVNERIEGLNRTFGALTQQMDIVCECGRSTCLERILVPLPDYEHVRSDPTRFMLVPGHDDPSVEAVVANGEGYVVVRKQGEDVERLAAETDPRS